MSGKVARGRDPVEGGREAEEENGGGAVKKARTENGVWSDPIPVGSGYSYFVGTHILAEVPARVVQLVPKASVFVIVSDENVARLYGDTVLAGFERTGSGRRALLWTLLPGEASKDRLHKEALEDWMLAHTCGRDTCVVALGGGVVGDLAGYAAATYMRGVPFVQVPTSLLAMVDSSLGGKTGVDTPAGKNLVGSFWNPVAVFADVALLRTLPRRELCNGLAECIKHGAIESLELFELLESESARVLAMDLPLVADVVHRNVRIKARIVASDEREGGLRATLNFGHSVGHAVEALMQPHLLHGECVAVGMVAEARLSFLLGHLPSEFAVGRIERCCQQYGLPTAVPHGLRTGDLLRYLAVDKKNRAGVCHVVMLSAVGRARHNPYTEAVGRETLAALLSPTCTVGPPDAPLRGTLAVPGSKSVSNRALLLAALGRGPCRLRGLLHSDDTAVMLEALRLMGVAHRFEDAGSTVVVEGVGGRLVPPDRPLDLHNAGTASRFLASAACLALRPGGPGVVLTGNQRMRERPVADLVDALRGCGVVVTYLGREGCLPVRLDLSRDEPAAGGRGAGGDLGGGLPGGDVYLSAGVSSQFVSSLLMSAPHARSPTVVHLVGDRVVSEPYVDMTVRLMARFGVQVGRDEAGRTYRVPAGAFDNPAVVHVEGDASSASYPLALAAITGGRITVSNVGRDSLQGDAGFCHLLARMGCEVEQTATATAVQGPAGGAAGLRGLGEVDLGPMTDTFMTLAVLAAVAEGTTRIVGIANQRVKECDRLAATARELSRLGASCSELPDGLEIRGTAASDLRGGTGVRCYDDHRIAMSFAVLGTVVPGGVHVTDKHCTGKTYPGFWDDVQVRLGLQPLAGAWVEAEASLRKMEAEETEGAPVASFVGPVDLPPGASAPPSLVFVGMRGAGKTELGRATAARLGLLHVDLDEQLERESGPGGIRALVEREGWPEFRRRELAALESSLARHRTGALISCGGGVVETPAALELLQKAPAVVQIARHIDDIDRFLGSDPTRPSLGEPPRSVYSRRLPLYRQCSRFEFVIRRGDTDWARVETELALFCCTVLGIAPSFPPYASAGTRLPAPSLSEGTYFVSLTMPSVLNGGWSRENMSEVCCGADAVELRADLLACRNDPDAVREEMAFLRRLTSLPVVWTVRTVPQGGQMPAGPNTKEDGEDELEELVLLGVRLGCRFVDVESRWSPRLLQRVHEARGAGQELIASEHVPLGNGGTPAQVRDLFLRCASTAGADVVKVVVMARDEADAVRLVRAGSEWRATLPDGEGNQAVPARPRLCLGRGARAIVLAMGEQGRVSRLLNRCLTPATHPLLPSAAAPGQMSVRDLQTARAMLGLLPTRRFYLLGTPISRSPSPAMHGAGFRRLLLPHTYELLETDDLVSVRGVLRSPDFGGASVTIPLKERVVELLDRTTAAAARIGAVNTVVREADGSLTGDNTDWIGIAVPLAQLLVRRRRDGGTTHGSAAVVVGAGGTARAALYALQQLGFGGEDRLRVVNPRTPARAGALAGEFGAGVGMPELPVSVLISTLPGASGYTMPAEVAAQRPAVVDVSYWPKVTPLHVQAAEASCPVVRGIDMLIGQGVAAFGLWTSGRHGGDVPPAMDAAARAFYDQLQ